MRVPTRIRTEVGTFSMDLKRKTYLSSLSETDERVNETADFVELR